MGRPDIPSLAEREAAAATVHGEGGKSTAATGWARPSFQSRGGRQIRAAPRIIDTIMANPGEITLVPLGPLTNIALAVATEPRIAENVREVVLMGGAANVAGNASRLPRPTSATIRSRPTSSFTPAGP